MKTFITTFLAVLVAGGLALLAYDHFVLEPRLQHAGEAARVSLDDARAEAREIAAELDTSLSESVAATGAALDERKAQEEQLRAVAAAQVDEQRQTAQAAEALMRAGMVKVVISEHYLSNGAWPRDMAELGMGAPADHAGGPVAAISLEREGVIAIAIKAEVAKAGVLRLIPSVSRSGMLEWTCKATNFKAATRLPACRS